MRRREFIAALGSAAAAASAWPSTTWAQRDQFRRVVIPMIGPESDLQQQASVAMFRDELHKRGWIDGQNIRLEFLWRGASAEAAKTYVAEIVGHVPDVVVITTLQGFLTMRREANTVPMVFVNLPDPVEMGFVSNIAKTEGNFTGFTAYQFAMAGKWLEVLKEIAPHVSRVAMTFGNATKQVGEGFYRSLQAAAGPLGVETTAIRIDTAADVQSGIDAFALKPNGGLVMAAEAGSTQNRALIIELAARHRIPAVYPFRNVIDEGGLAFYGIDFVDLYRGAAAYVDRILRGAKPSDLPIQAPTKFNLALNLKTAKALGLVIPLSLHARADEVIE